MRSCRLFYADVVDYADYFIFISWTDKKIMFITIFKEYNEILTMMIYFTFSLAIAEKYLLKAFAISFSSVVSSLFTNSDVGWQFIELFTFIIDFIPFQVFFCIIGIF